MNKNSAPEFLNKIYDLIIINGDGAGEFLKKQLFYLYFQLFV